MRGYENNFTKKNSGISMLRIICCFTEIRDRFALAGGIFIERFFLFMGEKAVPIWDFLSLYLTGEMFFKSNFQNLKKRNNRLYILLQ